MRTAGVLSIRRLKPWLMSRSLRMRRTICGVYMVLIAVLSLVPSWLFPPSLANVPGMDKWVHVAMYGVLGMLLRWTVGTRSGLARWWLPAAGAGYGLLMEFLQLWLCAGTRSFSWEDALANLAGVTVAWLWMDNILAKSGI